MMGACGYDVFGNLVTNTEARSNLGWYRGDGIGGETGLDYFGARYMSSAQGRFTSPDPAGLGAVALANPQTWNQYAYTLNNPLRFTDPTGMYTCADDNNKCQTDQDKAFEAARQRDLQSKDKNVVAAAAGYGDPTKDNHVGVQFTDSSNGNTNISISWNGKAVSYGITVSIPQAASGDSLDAMVGHEGTHVVQDQALAASFKPNGSFNGSLNLTSYDAENAAYHTEATIMQSSGHPQTLDSNPPGRYPVNPGDTPKQVDETINKFLVDKANGIVVPGFQTRQ